MSVAPSSLSTMPFGNARSVDDLGDRAVRGDARRRWRSGRSARPRRRAAAPRATRRGRSRSSRRRRCRRRRRPCRSPSSRSTRRCRRDAAPRRRRRRRGRAWSVIDTTSSVPSGCQPEPRGLAVDRELEALAVVAEREDAVAVEVAEPEAALVPARCLAEGEPGVPHRRRCTSSSWSSSWSSRTYRGRQPRVGERRARASRSTGRDRPRATRRRRGRANVRVARARSAASSSKLASSTSRVTQSDGERPRTARHRSRSPRPTIGRRTVSRVAVGEHLAEQVHHRGAAVDAQLGERRRRRAHRVEHRAALVAERVDDRARDVRAR